MTNQASPYAIGLVASMAFNAIIIRKLGIATYGEFLRGSGVLDAAARKQMESEILAETLASFVHAMASPNPVEPDLYRNVYAS